MGDARTRRSTQFSVLVIALVPAGLALLTGLAGSLLGPIVFGTISLTIGAVASRRFDSAQRELDGSDRMPPARLLKD